MDDNSFKIHGYNLTKVNRQNKSGGGICIFTRENIKIKMRNDLVNEASNSNTEFLFVEILNEKCKNVIVGIIYRPPSSKFNDFNKDLKTILTKLDNSNKPCYIMGDFNIDLLKYEINAVITQITFLISYHPRAICHSLQNLLRLLNRLHH